MFSGSRVVTLNNSPAPSQSDAEIRGGATPTAYKNGKKMQVGLEQAVKWWPTPMKSDGCGGLGCSGRAGGLNLRTAVTKFPTPTKRDHKGGADWSKRLRDGKRRPRADMTLPDVAEENGGQLNPMWVEWLMGWPLNWTRLDSLPKESNPLPDLSHGGAHEYGNMGPPWWKSEPEGVPRVAIGVKARVNRLTALGNGQVPACAAEAFRRLTARL